MAVSLPFRRYSALKNDLTLKFGFGSFKVIENGAYRQTMYDFLLVRHCNYTGWAKLNGANAVSFVIVKHI